MCTYSTRGERPLQRWAITFNTLIANIVTVRITKRTTDVGTLKVEKKTRKRTVRKDGVAPPVDYKAPFR